MMKTKIAVILVSSAMLFSFVVIIVEIPTPVKAGYIIHDPIRINNNTNLASIAGIEGWIGDGSPGNPYIIEGYDINGSGYGYCIYIGNTTDHFVVRDSYIHEANGVTDMPFYPDSGITLYNVQNGNITNNTAVFNNRFGIYSEISSINTFTNNTASDNFVGIYFQSSSGNILVNNTVSNNTDGISIRDSNGNTLVNNTAFSNNFRGIRIYCSNDNSFTGNKMDKCGIYIWGGSLANWNTHNIDTSNTVDGKPVYYWKNQTGGKVPSGAGEVILANCNNVIVENQNIRNGTVGIELGYSNGNTIANNTVSSNTQDGIYLKNSGNNIIINNTALNNGGGIRLSSSSGNTITNNNASSNSGGNGISLDGSNSNTVANNTALNNYRGIQLRDSYSNTITNNTSSTNTDDGIHLLSSSGNTFIKNTISSNIHYGIYFDLASGNTMYHNNFISNSNQAYQSHTNQWDDGYPSGGNYWSDYIGTDVKKGPNQDVPGSDGIGDSPYTGIGGVAGGKDNYPLMNPYIPLENYTILKQGWNLISVPLIQEEQNLTRVLGSIDSWYNSVQQYNVTDDYDHWKHYHILKPSFMNDLGELNHRMGFWIYITRPGDTIFKYNGTLPIEDQEILLYPGWNLVGYPSNTNQTRDIALNNTFFDTDVDSIWTYNSTSQKWVELDDPMDYFEVGNGYWIHSMVTKTWIVPH